MKTNQNIHQKDIDNLNNELNMSKQESIDLKNKLGELIRESIKKKKSDIEIEKMIDERIEVKVNQKMLI